MKLLLPLLGVVTMIGLAAPAYADNDGDATDAAVETGAVNVSAVNVNFINSLRAAGIGYSNDDQAVSAGKAMCGLIERGQRGLQVVGELEANNPGMSMEDAVRFAKIAATSYCPEQLVPAH